MRFLIMTDIEGVTGVTTYLQAEKSQFGRDMLMNDLLAVIDGIRSEEHHEIVVYDMHTDGRNIDITGAYIVGIVLCSLSDASYMESKIDINSYMFFSPIFFASIGLKTNLAGFDMSLLWFAFFFVLIGCCSKIIGCGAISKAMGFSWKESYQIGLGMMVRGEVALIVATKGLSV